MLNIKENTLSKTFFITRMKTTEFYEYVAKHVCQIRLPVRFLQNKFLYTSVEMYKSTYRHLRKTRRVKGKLQGSLHMYVSVTAKVEMAKTTSLSRYF